MFHLKKAMPNLLALALISGLAVPLWVWAGEDSDLENMLRAPTNPNVEHAAAKTKAVAPPAPAARSPGADSLSAIVDRGEVPTGPIAAPGYVAEPASEAPAAAPAAVVPTAPIAALPETKRAHRVKTVASRPKCQRKKVSALPSGFELNHFNSREYRQIWRFIRLGKLADNVSRARPDPFRDAELIKASDFFLAIDPSTAKGQLGPGDLVVLHPDDAKTGTVYQVSLYDSAHRRAYVRSLVRGQPPSAVLKLNIASHSKRGMFVLRVRSLENQGCQEPLAMRSHHD